jgi:glyoxylase-like metal-dependent hydrolase (beta-lactamase superfamily II)
VTKRRVFPALVAAALLACSCGGAQVDPFTAGVAAAMGGRGAIERSATLLIEGDGETYYFGENRAPDTDLPVFETRFRWAFDWGHARFRKEELRLPTFTTGSAGLRQRITALDGPVAYDIGGDQRARRAAAEVAANRRGELLRHPLGLLRAALSPGATVRPQPAGHGRETAEVSTTDGLAATLVVDSATKLPISISMNASDAMLGDVVASATFDAYMPVGPLRLPTRITESIDGIVVSRVHVISQTTGFDPDAPLPAPAFQAFSTQARLAAPPALMHEGPIPAPDLTTEPVAPGVWRVGAAQYWSVLVDLGDHFGLIEAPLDDGRTGALVAAARALDPAKPVTDLVVTHHHFDHIGGVRAAVASGMTLYVRGGLEPHAAVTAARSAGSRDEADFLAALLARPHTRVPDLLAKAPRAASIARVGEELTLGSAAGPRVVLYPIHGSEYADTLLMAYLPRERLLVEADVYSPPEPGTRGEPWYPFAANLLENIRSRHLPVERIVPLHGPVVPLAQLEEDARRPPPAATP